MRDAIIGHHQILKQLYHAIASNRVAGAYLFVGVANVGKETVALHFAKSINCRTSGEGACGTCLSCRKGRRWESPRPSDCPPIGGLDQD